jgi:hypothetical protein
MVRFVLLSASLLFSVSSIAHHSVSALYDYNNIIAVEGVVKKVHWINPHIRIELEHTNADGSVDLWKMDGSAVNLLRRLGVTPDVLKAGEKVTVKGPKSRRRDFDMIGSMIVFSDGREVALFPGSARRAGLAKTNPIAERINDENLAKIAPNRELGLFRVWTPRVRIGTDSGEGKSPWPMTESAIAAYKKFNPLEDDPALKCIQAGMPVILDTPYPVEFKKQGNDIIFKTEEWDVVRTFHMTEDGKAEFKESSPWGYSVGHWEDDTLVVETRNITYPYFDDLGTPQTEDTVIFERYTVSEDGKVVDWNGVAYNDTVFTKPATFGGDLVWIPGEEVKEFNCTLPDKIK